MKKRADEQSETYRSTAELVALYRAERRTEKSGLGRVIASRVLTEENARDSKIVVTIGAPRRVEADHWLCPFEIEGIVESGIHFSPGVDSLQSLILAIGEIRWHLEQSGRRFIWYGDAHGVPQQVSTNYGQDFAQRVEKAIERESKRAQVGGLRTRKAEIAAAEARLKALKKGRLGGRSPRAKPTSRRRSGKRKPD